MLIRCLGAEWVKLRRSRIWLVLLVLPVFSTLIGFANYWMNQAILQNGWYSLWTQVSLFYGEFFLPILIAICCSFACRLEHVNRNWNVILTAPVSTPTIFFRSWWWLAFFFLVCSFSSSCCIFARVSSLDYMHIFRFLWKCSGGSCEAGWLRSLLFPSSYGFLRGYRALLYLSALVFAQFL
ncbi:hypothetical protein B5G50_25620 [Brevibacillus brevis]|uniref:ABC transporter permease n=1 Tax=Brevibacillus brevis TaxID=1393 RepID=UPI000B38204A|nr:hypothetical protein B5G50_25620 [Brevibacillus brevis]